MKGVEIKLMHIINIVWHKENHVSLRVWIKQR